MIDQHHRRAVGFEIKLRLNAALREQIGIAPEGRIPDLSAAVKRKEQIAGLDAEMPVNDRSARAGIVLLIEL